MSGRVVEVSAREMGPVCLGVWNCVAEGRRDVVWRDQCLTDGMRVEEGGMGRGQHVCVLCCWPRCFNLLGAASVDKIKTYCLRYL